MDNASCHSLQQDIQIAGGCASIRRAKFFEAATETCSEDIVIRMPCCCSLSAASVDRCLSRYNAFDHCALLAIPNRCLVCFCVVNPQSLFHFRHPPLYGLEVGYCFAPFNPRHIDVTDVQFLCLCFGDSIIQSLSKRRVIQYY